MYFNRFSLLSQSNWLETESALRNICFKDDFSVTGKHIATLRQLHVEERAGFPVNCFLKKKDNSRPETNLYNCFRMQSFLLKTI